MGLPVGALQAGVACLVDRVGHRDGWPFPGLGLSTVEVSLPWARGWRYYHLTGFSGVIRWSTEGLEPRRGGPPRRDPSPLSPPDPPAQRINNRYATSISASLHFTALPVNSSATVPSPPGPPSPQRRLRSPIQRSTSFRCASLRFPSSAHLPSARIHSHTTHPTSPA